MPFPCCQLILLAAGAGRRFGDHTPKLLAGSPPLILQTLTALRAGLSPAVRILAVVRPDALALQALLAAQGVEVTPCAQADAGMGISLAHAAAQVGDDLPVLVALGDMPAIAPATLAAVRDALLAGASLVQPQWQGRRGHPVGFHPRWLPALRALRGDVGARHLLQEHDDQLLKLAVDDPGILLDIDTPAQLASLVTAAGASRAQ